jgi:hypothetical protein
MKKEVVGVGEQLQFGRSLWEVVGAAAAAAAAAYEEYGVGYDMLCRFGDNGDAY